MYMHYDVLLSQTNCTCDSVCVPSTGKDMYKTIENFSREKTKDAYCDIKDGFVYQQLVSNGFLSQPNNISFQLNTDGVPVFKSSGCSFWPIHLLINELPPSIRYRHMDLM